MLISAGSFSVFLQRRWIVVLLNAAVFLAHFGMSTAATEAAAGAGAGAATTTENPAAAVSSVAATCACQPLGPPGAVDSHLGTYLWTIVSTEEWSEQDVIQEFQQGFAPIVTALPGFQRYTAATTGNTATVFFMTAFETAEQVTAAHEAVEVFVATNKELKAAIAPLHVTQDHVVTGFPAGACITDGSVGKFLATRLYE